jgi:hypothetical protein
MLHKRYLTTGLTWGLKLGGDAERRATEAFQKLIRGFHRGEAEEDAAIYVGKELVRFVEEGGGAGDLDIEKMEEVLESRTQGHDGSKSDPGVEQAFKWLQRLAKFRGDWEAYRRYVEGHADTCLEWA